ncbi:response regulator transcription factor [Paenibacillus protaetiae]|uniref:Response regulator n=1 Tax=Paenibacillus protaetiae TaxID=2509456 RepID=A0A4P6F6K2_9BACL|nr:response regulator [Paenibacillus protaetiae]QAY66038.1 response regulator [Paenibacillus protaetiae]
MYRILLVDDERIILEGISTMVNWQSQGAELAGTARNGIEALDLMEKLKPDIVISDIKMPGMDGLQLVEKAYELFPGTGFILLSGFSEFDYARKAMQYGVKHYLLKPCNENVILEALQELITGLEGKRHREQFMQGLQQELAKVLPHAKEQFLKELVTNKTYGQRDWDDYRRLFRIEVEKEQVQLILFQPEGEYEYEHLFAIKNIAEDLLGKSIVLLGTTIGGQALLLLKESYRQEWLFEKLQLIKETFIRFYKQDSTIAVSAPSLITDARFMYRETMECLDYRFYFGEGTIISKKDIAHVESAPAMDYDDEKLALHLKSGNWDGAGQELELFFQELAGSRMDAVMTRSYLMTLLITIARQSRPEEMGRYMQLITKLDEQHTLKASQQFVTDIAKAVAAANHQTQKTKHSSIIERMIEVVNENIGDELLSLNWVASETLYMNADYLGKLFKKETGEKFSNFVMRQRIEKAVQLIEAAEDVKVFELAEQLGFGDNPQYFSQVFKKYTGQTPSEYRKAPK